MVARPPKSGLLRGVTMGQWAIQPSRQRTMRGVAFHANCVGLREACSLQELDRAALKHATIAREREADGRRVEQAKCVADVRKISAPSKLGLHAVGDALAHLG